MIHTPRKQKRWKDRHPKAYKNLVHYSIILLLLLAAVIALQPEQAAGEAIKSPEIHNRVKTAQSTTPAPKPSTKELPIPTDKQAIKEYIIKTFTEAGYKAPLFAVRVAMCESGLNTQSLGDHGQSRGIWQIHEPSHPSISDECAYSLECSTKWAAEQFVAGRAGMWTCARLLS